VDVPASWFVSVRLSGGETCREVLSDSDASTKCGNGEFELVRPASASGEGSATTVAWRLTLGLAEAGVANEPTLPVEVPVLCLNTAAAAGGGGVPAWLLPTPPPTGPGPNTSSNALSVNDLMGGENVAAMSVLPVRLKKGLLALDTDRAGLATCAGACELLLLLIWRASSS
jgi:hypothetical protein